MILFGGHRASVDAPGKNAVLTCVDNDAQMLSSLEAAESMAGAGMPMI